MLNIDCPDARALHQSLRREACATFERLGHAFERLTGSRPRQINWRAISCPGLAQFRATERTLGLALPADLVACYEACHGVVETGGWHWWPLHDVASQARLMHTIVCELRAGAPGGLASEGRFTPDGKVRADAWHRGWLPIGEVCSTRGSRVLCIDLAPGPAGQAGQLIEIEDPRFKTTDAAVPCSTRYLAPGLLAYFKGLALLLEAELARPEPDRRVRSGYPEQIDLGMIGPFAEQEAAAPASHAWRGVPSAQTARWPDHCADTTVNVAPLVPTQDTARRRAEQPILENRAASVLPMRSGDEFCHGGRRLYGDEENAASWLRQWAASPDSGFALLVGWHGDGKTDLLRRLAEELAAGGDRVPFCIDLKAWQNANESSQVPATLAELVGEELQRRGLQMAPADVLQAVSDGRCLLMLDHIEALAAASEEVWTWCQQLPLPSVHGARRQARVLLACSQEWFGSDELFLRATDGLFRARLDRHESVHVLGLKPVDPGVVEAWLNQWALEPRDPLAAACREFLSDTRGLPAKLNALQPLVQQRNPATDDGAPPGWFALYAAWWRAVSPTDLGMDEESLATHAVCIALAQAHDESGREGIALDQHARLVAEMWPDDSAARSARRLMATRIALCLQAEENDRATLANARRWLAHATLHSLEQGDLDAVVLGLGRGSHRATAAMHTAWAWYEAGHAEPPPCLREWLREPQPPETAGALFQLGCSMARHLASGLARAAHATGKAVQPRLEGLRHAMSLALPWPLSAARLVGANLPNADLSWLPLEDLDLRDANLCSASFVGCDLTRVQLDGALAERANFSRARLVDVSAAGLRARSSLWLHARWDRRWPEADLEGAQATVPGHTPCTAESEYPLHGSPGGAPSAVGRLVASADGHWLASFGPGQLGMWRAADLTPVWQLQLPPGPAGEMLDLCFSHDDQRLCASHADLALRYWRVADGAYLGEEPYGAPLVHQLLRAGNGTHLLGVRDTQVPSWMPDAPTYTGYVRQPSWLGSGAPRGAVVQRPQGRGFAGCTRGRFSDAGVFVVGEPNSRQAVAWGSRHAWRLATGWDSTAQTEWLAIIEPGHLVVGKPTAEQALCRIERPQAVIHGEAYLNQAALEKQRMGPRGASLAPADCLSHHTPDREARIADLAFSPDGRWLVCVGNGQPGIALDTRTGATQELAGTLDVNCAVFAADGHSLVLAGPGLRRLPWPPVPRRAA